MDDIAWYLPRVLRSAGFKFLASATGLAILCFWPELVTEHAMEMGQRRAQWISDHFMSSIKSE
jgi:hypothetical protein